MGALSAFLTGAGGAGMVNLSQTMERRAELQSQQEQRAQELQAQAEQRRAELEQRAAENQKDRDSREAMLMDRLGAGALGAAGSRGGARGGAGADPVAEREMAINRLAAEKGLSRPEAAQMLADYESGNNRFTKTEAVPEQIDDGDRQRTVTRQQSSPDVEKFASMMSTVAKHLSQAGAYTGAKADDQAKAEQLRTQTGMAERAQTDPNAGRGALYIAGKGEYGETGSSHVTGAPVKGSVAESQIIENKAQANNANASAGAHSARIQEIKAKIGLDKDDLKGKSKERLATMLNSLNTYVKDMNLSEADVASINQLRGEITLAMSSEVSSRSGAPSAPAAGAQPAPGAPKATVKALPPGAKQIGTSGGKPVYQTPDGKRFIGG
jgi:hypothetical protein